MSTRLTRSMAGSARGPVKTFYRVTKGLDSKKSRLEKLGVVEAVPEQVKTEEVIEELKVEQVVLELEQTERTQINELIIPKDFSADFDKDKGLFGTALAHLVMVDPRFAYFAEQHPCSLFDNRETPVDAFESLASSIISQQISGAAARSIKARLVDLFGQQYTFPTPQMVLAKTLPELRSVGLSGRKAEYLLDLASKFNSGEIDPHALVSLSDAEVIELLVKVRGLGVWSAEMFLLFALKRPDVFSLGDLGVQRGMAVFYGKNVALAKGKKGKFKYMSEQEMIERAELYRPYRSLFMWYMWRAASVVLPMNTTTT